MTNDKMNMKSIYDANTSCQCIVVVNEHISSESFASEFLWIMNK